MIRQYTNLAWPDDPYGTGNRQYRRQVPLLAGFAAVWADDGDRTIPIACAVAYLRLHRTRIVSLDAGNLPFGYHAAAIDTDTGADVEALCRVFDLDLLQARKHADVLAGCSFLDDLYCMDKAAITFVPRAVWAVTAAWQHRDAAARGTARMVDIANGDEAGLESLRQVCIRTNIAPGSALRGLALPSHVAKRWAGRGEPGAPAWLAAAATEKALMVALVAGRLDDRVVWHGRADIGAALSQHAGGEFDSEETRG
ncbi:hypothetical protein ABZ897_43435 [Nonomuraea sp. NPDC046802]|uniref:hypothetical protein n=1 Tax=Nonomuraea sp. NPDC046802 TaxID=3154919 RepID=UPI0033C7153A